MTPDEIDNVFTYHKPVEDQPLYFEVIRKSAKAMAEKIMDFCPDSAERDKAIQKLREAVMWANAAIACNS